MSCSLLLSFALASDIAHWVFIVYILIGLPTSVFFKTRLPRFALLYRCTSVAQGILFVGFGARCPLTLLSGYLRAMASGTTPGSSGAFSENFYQPFLVAQLKQRFGFELPDLIITIAICLLGAACFASLLYAHKAKQKT